jgi:hypothetical protein
MGGPGGGSPRDPRRIALIAVRTGSADPGPNTNPPAQAIVVGEVPVAGGVIVDPTDPAHVGDYQWEWRYALFDLPDLERMFARASREVAQKVPWQQIPHPLDGPAALGNATYYDQLVANPTQLLSDGEKNDLLSTADLSADLRAQLQQTITPPVDDAGTQGPAVARLNFAIPLRDVVRLAIYTKDNQPFGRDQDVAGGPLVVLDTCRYVKTGGTTGPEKPTGPSNDPPGSRIILFADPRAVDKGGPNNGKKDSATGKLFGFAVLAQVRLPLNGHADDNNAELEKSRGLFRFFALTSTAGRAEKVPIPPVPPATVPSSRTVYPLFGPLADQNDDGQGTNDADGQGIGPYFDSMRVGFTTGTPSVASSFDPRRYCKSRAGYVGELSGDDARAVDPAPGSTNPQSMLTIPIFDQLGIGFTTDGIFDPGHPSLIRILGFRFLTKDVKHRTGVLALRFEGNYHVTKFTAFGLSFAPASAVGQDEQSLRFAQEQPLNAINWSLSPSRSVRWIFTARVFTPTSVTTEVIKALKNEVQQIYSGLRHTQDASPLSCLPILSVGSTGALAWHFVGSLIDREPYNRRVFLPNVPKPARKIDADFYTLEPRFIDDMWAGDQSPPVMSLAASADFQRLTLTSGGNPIYDVVLSAPTVVDPTEQNAPPWVNPPAFQPAMSGRDAATAYRGVMVGIKVIKKTATTAPARIGALDIGLASNFPNDSLETDGLLRFLQLKAGPTDPSLPDSAIDALIKLPVGSAVAGGQDELPSDAQISTEDRVLDALRDAGPDPDAPLVIPLQVAAAGNVARTLYINETVARHRNHTLELSLKAVQTIQNGDGGSNSAADSTGKLLVIDPAPFRVAAIKTRDIAAGQTNESDEVAVWNAASGNGLSWRIVDDTGTVSLLLPPQVIGEAMEKNRRTDGGRPPDITEDVPAAARIGSLTRLDLDPSYFDTRYVEPGWNLRRLMGYPGQRAPGAGLRDLRLELMYGIMTRLTPAGVRIAEMGAVVGAPATSLSADSDSPNVRAYITAFNAVRAGQNRRLAVDRLWQGNALDDLTIEQGASFRLRTKAAWRSLPVTVGGTAHAGDTLTLNITLAGSAVTPPPHYTLTASDTLAEAATALAAAINSNTNLKAAKISADTPAGSAFNLNFGLAAPPVTASVTGAGATTTLTLGSAGSTAPTGPLTPFRWPVAGDLPPDIDPALAPTFGTDTDDAKTFPGGVPWAFESSNILRSVYRTLDGDGGRARGVHLSALGGWGNQRGLFDENKTAIETETTMGRVHRYALERIGRIGALWHRAKHIIIYERSVVPSAQFYNTPPIGKEQDQLLGRPVLRKVEEYVELLQQIRRYPEDGKTIEAAGCITGADFVTRRIRVDSRWGGDVRNEGWQVPLWNKAFDRPPENPDNPDDPTFVYPKPHIRVLVMGEGNVEKSLEIAEPEKLVFYTSTVKGETGDDTDAWHPVRDIDFVDLPLPQVAKAPPKTGDLHDGLLPAEPPHVSGYEQLTIGLMPSKDAAVLTHGRQDKGPAALLHNVTIARAAAVSVSGAPASGPSDPAREVVGQVADSIGSFRLEFDKLTSQLSEAARIAATAPGATRDSVKTAVSKAAKGLTLSNATGTLKWPDPKTIDAFTKKNPCAEQRDRILAEVNGQLNRANEQVDALFTSIDDLLTAEIVQIHAAATQVTDTAASDVAAAKTLALNFLNGLSTRLVDLDRSTSAGLAQANANADAIVVQFGGDVSSLVAAFDQQRQTIVAALKAVVDKLNDATPTPGTVFDDAIAAMQPARQGLGQVLADAASNNLPQSARTVLLVLDKALASAQSLVAHAQQMWNTALATARQDAANAKKAIDDVGSALDMRKALYAGNAVISKVTTALDNVGQGAQSIVSTVLAGPKKDLDDLRGKIDSLQIDELASGIEALANELALVPAGIRQSFQDAQTALHKAVGDASTELTQMTGSVCAQFDGALAAVYSTLQEGQNWINETVGGYQDQLEHALDNISDDAAQLAQNAQDAVTGVGREMEARARELMGGLQQRAADYLGGRDPADVINDGERVFQQGADTLRLLRAVGDPPKTDQLGFNRPEVAYVFQEANKIVDMTPTISLVNRVADSAAALGAAAASADKLLTSFGIRLPTSGIGDQLMPDALKNLDISKLFPDFSGIKLDGLFKNLGFPSLTDSNAVKVTHGLDQTDLTAWLEADIDVPFTDSAPLMDFGPVQIMIDEAQFTASARISEGRAGMQKTMHGQLFGDWRVVCAGQTILTFRQTGLTFDQTGHINFNIQPDRVELADALQFLTNLVAATGQDGDFEIVPYMYGGVPSGIAARLDMVLPPIQTGVFGIDDLSLHLLFGVSALPEFEIVTELAVGAKLAPFTLNVWILNGGGFVTARLAYLPTHSPAPLLMFTLEVGIVAGVGLGFSFGVVSGGVWIQVGCAIAITWTTGPGGSTTSVTVFLLVRGNVDVMGIITVGLTLLLAISYNGSQMVASGTLNLTIKISVFFTLSVSEHVEYDFAGGKSSSSSSYSESYA